MRWMATKEYVPGQIGELEGKTLQYVEERENDLYLTTTEGSLYVMGHVQDCCEHVEIESGLEDLKSLIGQELVQVTEDTEHDNGGEGSRTWTFYTFRSNQTTAQLRWLGESNGYYSESVSFYRSKP